jgi:NAD-dependent SIR2 family protein deacetylase
MKVATSAAQAKIVFLIGAGASMPLGLPDTGRFLQHLLHSTKGRDWH